MTSLRSVASNVIGARDRLKRALLKLPAIGPQSGEPKCYFLTPDYSEPAGGIRVMYRHVDILNAAGLSASILHQARGFRCAWFPNSTQVASVSEVQMGERDLLVVGELDIDLMIRDRSRIRHVVLNQSGFLTFGRGNSEAISQHYASSPYLDGAVVVSGSIEELLRYAFPLLEVRRVTIGVDTGVFYPRPGPRLPQIACMPRRGASELNLIQTMLASRGGIGGWEFKRIGGVKQPEVVSALSVSSIFLALSVHEGFGLPVAEAMACGNYVIGFHGFGGRELFQPEFTGLVDTGDILGAARAIEYAIEMERKSPGWLARAGSAAAEFIGKQFSVEAERASVVGTYVDFLYRR